MGKPPVTAKSATCVLTRVDPATRQGRDPFARQGVSGNRWIRYGCDGLVPGKYKKKLESAVKLAYDLNNKADFVQKYNELVKKTASVLGQSANKKTLSYLDALDKVIINFAETSADPLVKKEIKETAEAKKRDPTYLVAGGFTIGRTGRVFLREFALANWTDKQLAGLVMHESCHVAGAPNDMLTEITLSTLYGLSYAPPVDH